MSVSIFQKPGFFSQSAGYGPCDRMMLASVATQIGQKPSFLGLTRKSPCSGRMENRGHS
jgi:hypothetical protein